MFFAGGGVASASSAGQQVEPELGWGRRSTAASRRGVSGLLGGFRADADAGTLEASFLDTREAAAGPAAHARRTGRRCTRERDKPVSAEPHGRFLPPLARSVPRREVAGRTRTTGGYSDAYFDNIALTVSPPQGGPPPADPGPGDPPGCKPFAGISCTGAATVDRKGRVAMRLASVDGTVGHSRAW